MVPAQRVTAQLRIRHGAPSTLAPRVGALTVGATIYPEAQVVGEAVAGNATWFQIADNGFVWGGGCVPAQVNGASPASLAMDVERRPDGSLRAMSLGDITRVFGNFPYTSRADGRIDIDRDWMRSETATVSLPLVEGSKKISVHRKAADAFTRAFDAIATAGLQSAIRTYDGAWVPRHVGWDPTRRLSSHSWGIAIDLNARWNGYGVLPAALGRTGSVREIVGLFEAQGFAWGGYFQPLKICDGMHFELARKDL
jgi:hypothetical protein